MLTKRFGGVAIIAAALVFLAVLCAPAPSGEDTATIVLPLRVESEPTSTPMPPTSTPTPPGTPTAIPSTPTPTPIPIQTVRLSFSGDILSHSGVYSKALEYARANQDSDLAFDYRPMFAEVQDRITNADLALCVLETPVSADNTNLSGYPTFNAPRELPDALVAVGFDGCSTASNHSYDRGESGVVTTLEQMDRVGLGHAGMARSAAEAGAVRTYEVDGVTIAHLSYTYGLNGFVLPPDKPWLVNVTEVDAVLMEAERAREAGADIVVLSIQWGNEYVTEPTANQVELAEVFTLSPNIDLIVGNHAHVVQPVSLVNDKVVIYGLGNFLSNQSGECCPARSQDGVIIEVTFSGNDESGWTMEDLVAVPTWVDRTTYTILPVVSTLAASEAADSVLATLAVSRDRTKDALTQLGYEVRIE